MALLLLQGAAAQAQIINDPTTTMMMNANSTFKPIDTRAVAEQSKKEEEKQAQEKARQEKQLKEAAAQGASKAKPLPANLQPTLEKANPSVDNSEASTTPPAPAGEEPLKARAVMVDINSNTLNYDKDRDVYVATGAVHMIISEQNSELFADKLTYDQNQDLAIAEGKVVIIKNGQKTEGSYAKIDLTRKSALINDTATTLSAVRVKAKQTFVNSNELQLENGRMIISGMMYQQMMANGGMRNISQGAGKGSQQARLRRQYSQKVIQNRAMYGQMSLIQQQALQKFENLKTNGEPNFDESPDKVSRFSLKAKEIDIVRHEDGYDEINLKHPSLYMGNFKLATLPDTDFSYDQTSKNLQYLGPDIGGNRAYGGSYAGPGWDFHVGRGSLRLSPVASFGSPGFWSSNGQTGKQIKNGLGFGGVAHYRDDKTAIDLAYNSHVGSPVLFADRQLFGSTHVMASYNDLYQNGLLGQNERPNYIAQLTDYRVLKDFNKFQLSSFESLGMARDNFYPNFRQNYFVESKGGTPQTLGRAQLQFQLQNTQPLLQVGKYASFGMRAQLLSSAYSSSDFVALGRIGPTMTLNLLNNHLQTNMSYTLTHSIGKSPFVFDSYYGGAQNLSVSNTIMINKYLSLCNTGSYSLNRDNAQKALTVGNLVYMMVGPQDFKASIGYDFINARSYFGFNFYPGPNNTVVNFDQARVSQPASYKNPAAVSRF